MRIIKIAAIFAGTVLGAGFASGQELMIFFSRFGHRGIFGAVLSGVLIALFGAVICAQGFALTKRDYITYLKSIFTAPLAGCVYFITQLFMCISFSIMISGSSELLYAQFGIPKLLGEFLTLLICGWCLANRVTGIARLNLYLTPIMSVGILFVSMAASFGAAPVWVSFSDVEENFLVSACLYMSYNILTSAAVLASASSIAKSRREAALGGAAGGTVLLLVMVFSSLALVKFAGILKHSEFPMLMIAENLNKILGYLYPPLIYMAMLTTAVSSGFCACEVLEKTGMGNKTAAIVLCIAAVPLSMIRFSLLIKNCYMLFGFLGLMLIVGIIIKVIKNKENSRKYE